MFQIFKQLVLTFATTLVQQHFSLAANSYPGRFVAGEATAFQKVEDGRRSWTPQEGDKCWQRWDVQHFLKIKGVPLKTVSFLRKINHFPYFNYR